MGIVFDEKKNKINPQKQGLSLDEFEAIDWESSLTAEDGRRDYVEDRFITLGMIGQRLHVAVWCWRGEDKRVISLRKANKREQGKYDQQNSNA